MSVCHLRNRKRLLYSGKPEDISPGCIGSLINCVCGDGIARASRRTNMGNANARSTMNQDLESSNFEHTPEELAGVFLARPTAARIASAIERRPRRGPTTAHEESRK